MAWQLLIGYVAVAAVAVIGSERRTHQVQLGSCSYTFLLPESSHCTDSQVSNSLQRDTPTGSGEHTWHRKKLENLETMTENNTQWLQKLESYIQENVGSQMEEIQRSSAHTHTAAILKISADLLSQSAEHTRKLSQVETQVLNRTSQLEVKLLEFSLSTSNLEKKILLQTQEIQQLSDQSRLLEQRLAALEDRHAQELQQLQQLQSHTLSRLEAELSSATRNTTQLQRQHAVLLATLRHCNGSHQVPRPGQQEEAGPPRVKEIYGPPRDRAVGFRDCAQIFRSGVTESGVYSLQLSNSTRTVQVFCDMVSDGGGWTVLQHRQDGSVDFHRTWREYKTGFGDPAGEHWAGNDVIHHLTSAREYTLSVLLRDAEGNEARSLYQHFHIDGEAKNYSLHVSGFSGSAGRTSSLAQSGTPFSTKDRDNDRCRCKCAQLATGGWWFEACGPSNLNGVFYTGSSSVAHYNSIKWYYWKGPSMVAAMTTMMVRPLDF